MAKEKVNKRSSDSARRLPITKRPTLGAEDGSFFSRVLLNRLKQGRLVFSSVLLFIVVGCVFLPSLRDHFVDWDDDTSVFQNPHLTGLNLGTLRWMFTDLRYVWRYTPLVWLTREIIYELQGGAPFGYHLVSLMVHGFNAVWLFLVIRKLLPMVLPVESKATSDACLLICPALGAWLWAVHPLRVEPVAWASGYLHCQSVFFMLLSLWLYLEAVTQPSTPAKGWRYWLSVLGYLASLFSFPSTLGLVPLLVILDVYPLRRFGRGPGRWWNAAALRIWLEKIPFAALALLTVGVGLLARFNPPADWPQPVTLAQFSLFARIMQACYVWAYFLWKPWVPFDLSPVYTTLVQFNPADWPFWLSAAMVVGLTVWLACKWREWPGVLVLWGSYLVLLVPVLGLTEHPHYPSDRYSYLPTMLWSVLLSAGLFKLCRTPRIFVASAAASIVPIILLGAMSIRQTTNWRDSVSFFECILARLGDDPYRADIHWRLGKAYAAQNRLDDALNQYRETLRLKPDSTDALNNLGIALGMKGRLDEAISQFQEAIRLKPDIADAYCNLGLALAMKGQVDKAIRQYHEAIRLKPNHANAYYNLGLALAVKGQVDEAIRQFQEALRLKPDHADARRNLDLALAAKAASLHQPGESTNR
jgi:Tfp pilus assembly protein PilF